MVHRIDAKNRVEGITIERQSGIRIRHFNRDPISESSVGHALSGGSDSCLIGIDARNSATCGFGQIPRRSAGATGDFENMMLRSEVKPRNKPIVFVGCGPTVLANVLAESFFSYCLKDLLGKMAVRAVEEINAFRHG